ncbi:MAG: hypothetical protein NTW21_08930 [Verrucomicrobia bacterium]|nr:hypothetical protein [Verrucomicrobiota bacterium]
MDPKQSNNFNERLSQWVASQGFWFQIRYSMSSGGSKSVLAFHLLRMATRLLVLLVVAVIGLWVYLLRLPGTVGFQEKLKQAVGGRLGATELEMRGFRRLQGELLMSRFASEGGRGTFFSTLEARNIKCQMSFLNSLPGEWNPGVLLISQLEVTLNAGADDEKSAGLIGDSLFNDFGRLKLETLEVKSATLRWGYSERSSGVIAGTHMKVQRVGDGWRVHLSGGRFSQSWLRRLEIVELVASCTRDGVVFEKAEFRKGPGSISMDGLKVVGGQRPEVKGTVKVRKLPLEDTIPPTAMDFIEGSISGDFRVFGSTNTTEGIGFEGKVVLNGTDVIKLRDRLYLLRALTEFDVFNNYKVVAFKEGSLQLKIQGGGMELSEVQLKAGDLMTLAGQMRVRFPTPEEAAAAVRRNRAGELVPATKLANDEANPAKGRGEDPDFTLQKAAHEVNKNKDAPGATDEDSSLFNRISQSFEASLLAEQAAERGSRSLIYEGQFQITLLPDTFENVQALRELLPVDPVTGRIPLEVPIKGDIYSITFDQTEDLYSRGQRY